MKRIIILAIVAVCVWLMAIYPHIMLNPGELVSGHQNLKDKCKSCHEPFWGISSEKCISCHKLDAIGKDTSGIKESLIFHNNLKNQECTSCHTDHKGIKPAISLSKFNHNFLPASEQSKCNSCHQKPTNNLHSQLAAECNNCHSTKGWKSTLTFNHEMIQGTDKNNCIACHKKPNDAYHGSFKNNCSECHGTDKWVPSSFDHSAYFLLDKNHNTNCITCHSDNNFKMYTCYGCHEHSESKIREEHSEEGISNFANCVSCHKSGNEHETEHHQGLDQKDSHDEKIYNKSENENRKNERGNKNDDDD